ANTILVDSLIIESDTLENDNSATNDLGIGLIKEEKVEKTVFPKKNIDGTQQVQSAEIATKPPIETNNEVIIDPVVQAKENTIAKVETYDIQPEKKEQEMPEIVKKGIINVMAASAKQATPEGGFTGLNQYIKNGYTYPDVALQSDLQGEVLVQFSLTTDGRITDLQIVSGLSKECDNIVKNIIQNGPKWQPFVGDDFVEYRSASLKFIFKL
ncbi:MAG: energy transducer TonB, partial [Cyclobacteriaceae bacterium]|nr:energy transducer TonB [Cyclobacteriaceae bacterium]